MRLIINGRETSLVDSESLLDLLEQLAIPTDRRGVAVAVNDDVFAKEQWEEVVLQEGDRIDIIQAVQGG